MDSMSSDNAAFTMLHEAAGGKNISDRYNSLSLPEQRQVLSSMRQLQSEIMGKFGNIELIDSNRDGILDDARANVNGIHGQAWKDVYNPSLARLSKPDVHGSNGIAREVSKEAESKPDSSDSNNGAAREIAKEAEPKNLPTQADINRDSWLRQADALLRQAARGGDIYRQYARFAPESAGEMLSAMKLVQAAKHEEYGHINLIDANKDGVLDDVRVLAATRSGTVEVDAFKTPTDQRMGRIERDTVDGAARAGQIVLEEAIRGIGRGDRGTSTGDRIQRRMGQETIRSSNRILRDVLGGRH